MLRKAHLFPPANRKWIALLLAALLAVAGAGCADAHGEPAGIPPEGERENGPPDEADEQQTRPHYTFAVIFPDSGEFWSPILKRTEEYAEKKGWQLIDCTDRFSADTPEMLERFQVDGIIVSANQAGLLGDEALDPKSRAIPIVVLGQYPSGRGTHVGTDNRLAGRNIGNAISKRLAPGERVLICASSETDPACARRIDGVRSYLKDVRAEDIRIVYGEGTDAILAAMQETGRRGAVMAAVDREASRSLVTAYKAIGKDDAPWRLICFDDTPGNLQALRDGDVQAVVAQKQESWGEAALNLLRMILEGLTVPEALYTGTVEITADNIDTYGSEAPYSE